MLRNIAQCDGGALLNVLPETLHYNPASGAERAANVARGNAANEAGAVTAQHRDYQSA